MLEIFSPLLETAAQFIAWPGPDKAIGFVSSLAGAANPWLLLALFFISSLLMIWRLNVIETKGFQGAVIGTLGRLDIAYSSQIGDAHIYIPMCIGIYAVFSPADIPASFATGIWILLGAILAHLFFWAYWGDCRVLPVRCLRAVMLYSFLTAFFASVHPETAFFP